MHISTLDSQRSILVHTWAVSSKVLGTWGRGLDKAFFCFMFFHTLGHHPYTPVNTFKIKNIQKRARGNRTEYEDS